MSRFPKVIGCCGLARSGKDTFFNGLDKINGERFFRDAFADRLKEDLADLAATQWGWDIFTLDDEQKKVVRPLLVAYGCAWRAVDPLHWVKLVDEGNKSIHGLGENLTLVIPDFRFLNEVAFFQEKYKDDFILVDIIRTGVVPPNAEERENYPKIAAHADFKIEWPSFGEGELDKTMPYILDFYNTYYGND